MTHAFDIKRGGGGDICFFVEKQNYSSIRHYLYMHAHPS